MGTFGVLVVVVGWREGVLASVVAFEGVACTRDALRCGMDCGMDCGRGVFGRGCEQDRVK